MDYDSKEYNESNVHQMKDGIELMDKIKDQNNNHKHNIVVDIGCGTGNLTTLLNSCLTVDQIFGIDIDKHMIAFAEQNHSNHNIEYIVQDFGVDWNQFRPELKSIEGKVSLIFSNYCFHWIKNKENVAKNLYRLLSKSGKIYTRFMCLTDPTEHLTIWRQILRPLMKALIRTPSIDRQRNEWINAFNSVGFELIENEVLNTLCKIDPKTYREHVVPLSSSMYAMYSPLLNAKLLGITAKLQMFSKDFIKVDEKTGLKNYELNLKNFMFVLKIKNSNENCTR